MTTLLQPELSHRLRRPGFAFVPAEEMRRLLADAGRLDDWPAFVDSYNDLGLDTYMADGGRYRRRRHAVFSVARGGAITREPDQPHYQGLEWNPLNGGIERRFQPVDVAIGAGMSLGTILSFCERTFGGLAPEVPRWRVEIHQFRIEARAGAAGKPTPEGMHRDGVDYVLVLLVQRANIASGTTTISDLEQRTLGSFTLERPLDAALVDDRRVYHGVTAVEPVDPALPAFRDVLVVTFRAAPAT